MMQAPATIWPLEAIWEAVVVRLPGFSVELLPQIDSTNSELLRRLRAGQTEPVLLLAERQSAGRGRLGRQWSTAEAEPGAPASALTFSLSLPLHCADWSGLSLAVGLAALRGLTQAAGAPIAGLGLKWPNDLWCDGRKLGGILIETASAAGSSTRHAVIGVGINMLAPHLPVATQAGAAAPVPPVGLRELAPGLNAGAAWQAVVLALVDAVLRFEQAGFAAFAPAYAAHDLLYGQVVGLSDGRQGIAQGVDATGAMLVDIDGQRQAITSGELSVRPLHNTQDSKNGPN